MVQKIKNELNQLGIKPKKSLGQNFLINEGIYRKIIAATEIERGDIVVEIGPGLGTLTQYLLDTGAEVVAVEKDTVLAGYLKQKFVNQKHVKIIEGDILKFNPSHYSLITNHYKLVGNIPYYLTSHLLRIIFETWPSPELIVLTLQKEVAQRICAKPPKMSLLAVSVQYYSKPKIVSYVSKNSFWPAPEVDSAIVRLKPHARTDADLTRTNAEHFFQVVKIGFSGKRKQLGNNLARELKLTKKFVEEKLKSISVEPKRRAETLTLNEWQNITITLLPH